MNRKSTLYHFSTWRLLISCGSTPSLEEEVRGRNRGCEKVLLDAVKLVRGDIGELLK